MASATEIANSSLVTDKAGLWCQEFASWLFSVFSYSYPHHRIMCKNFYVWFGIENLFTLCSLLRRRRIIASLLERAWWYLGRRVFTAWILLLVVVFIPFVLLGCISLPVYKFHSICLLWWQQNLLNRWANTAAKRGGWKDLLKIK